MPELPAGGRQPGAARVRRAHGWLRVAFFVHCTLIVYVWCLVSGGAVRPIGAAVAGATLAVTPLVLLLWRERRASTARRPSHWVGRGSVTVPAHAVGVAVATSDLFMSGTARSVAIMVIAMTVSAIELVPVVLASRILRRPLSADLGEIDMEIRLKVRSAVQWLPSWLAQDDVRLGGETLAITVRPGPTWAYAKYIGLAEIRDVDVRRSKEQDGPWFPAVEGHTFCTPPGDVVVIRHGEGAQVLPVVDAAGFAEVLRARVEGLARTGPDRA